MPSTYPDDSVDFDETVDDAPVSAEDELEQLRDERAENINAKTRAQARLSEIKNLVRGKHVPPMQYRELTNEQTQLIRQVADFDRWISLINQRIKDAQKAVDGVGVLPSHVTLDKILTELIAIRTLLEKSQKA